MFKIRNSFEFTKYIPMLDHLFFEKMTQVPTFVISVNIFYDQHGFVPKKLSLSTKFQYSYAFESKLQVDILVTDFYEAFH